ncbi:MAG: antitoxin VbhA family protein [Clostridia bacterium]|nr:antitoxin VbhA family protein [Clostridia bacterium]MBO5440277.1 antitoxin VbhA family protein [Clostridia bacterium]
MSEAEKILKSMNNAEASINMEGFYVSEESKELCRRLLNKEISFDEYLSNIKSKLVRL